MEKKPSYLWALVIGILFPVLQVIDLLVQVGRIRRESPLSDYLIFFLSGSLIGVGLIYFLRRSGTKGMVRGTIIGLIVGLPFALFGMIFGSMAGPLAGLLLIISPAVFFTGIGFFLGRIFSRK